MKNISPVSPGARARGRQLGGRALLACLLLASLGSLPACNGDDDPTFPQPIIPEARHWLFDIEGTGPSDIWACGNNGAMFHFDGAQWQAVDMGSNGAIVRMYRDPAGALYACGHGGKIWRNSGTAWSSMETGTSLDLYTLGSYLGNVHAGGRDGILLRLAGSSWAKVDRNVMILRDAQGAPQDTLFQNQDVEAILTINHYAIGGAYRDPRYNGPEVGMLGTDGMILSEDNEYDWILRPLGGDQLINEEWILCTFSDPDVTANNYLGSSEGWLFRLNEDGSWNQMRPKVTNDPNGGIRDIWMDAADNIYMATDEGQVVFQTYDYNFVEQQGRRVVLTDLAIDFAAIWGTSPDDLYVVGFFEDQIIHGRHDLETDTFEIIEWIDVAWPDKGFSSGPLVDQFGRPLY